MRSGTIAKPVEQEENSQTLSRPRNPHVRGRHPSESALSRNKPNLVAFYDREHGIGSASTLRQFVESALAQAGMKVDRGPIRLLTMPRVFGYVFNPLILASTSAIGASARLTLAAVLYEVHNTFGQRHS
jgi:DUF1365 family protein